MPIDHAVAARRPSGYADDHQSDLVALIHRHAREVIDAEMRRLAGRVPSLSPTDLDIVGTALEELADSTILVPLRNARSDTALLLTRIFRPE
jgi:hypothetical protein